jgi:hypothetical protein
VATVGVSTGSPASVIDGTTVTPGDGPKAVTWARETLWVIIGVSIGAVVASLVWAFYLALVHGYAAGNATLAAEGTYGGVLVAAGGGIAAVWGYFRAAHPGFTLFEPEGPEAGSPPNGLSPEDEQP